MTTTSSTQLVSLIADAFGRQGWTDQEGAGLKMARSAEAAGAISPAALAQIPTATFLARNGVTRAQLRTVLGRSLQGVVLTPPRPTLSPIDELPPPLGLQDQQRPPLIPIEDITSFAAAGTVSPHEVSALAANTLPIPEEKVKEFIAGILGEPYLDTDWGGELSDIYTPRIDLDNRRVVGAFLLKGAGSKPKLRPSDLGKNGDQIRRLSKQDADLYVVQHVGQFDEAVRDQFKDMIVAKRSSGAPNVVGSLWDGSDCARLFIAHGLIDPETGAPIP